METGYELWQMECDFHMTQEQNPGKKPDISVLNAGTSSRKTFNVSGVLTKTGIGETSRLFRFALSGTVSTAAYATFVLALLYFAKLQADIASVLAYLGAIGVSYLLQSRFTFRTREDTPFRIVSFTVISLMGLAISYGAMALLSVKLGLPPALVLVIICVIIPVINYFVFKLVIFKQD